MPSPDRWALPLPPASTPAPDDASSRLDKAEDRLADQQLIWEAADAHSDMGDSLNDSWSHSDDD